MAYVQLKTYKFKKLYAKKSGKKKKILPTRNQSQDLKHTEDLRIGFMYCSD